MPVSFLLQAKANAYMKEGVQFTPASADYSSLKTDIDAKTDFVKVHICSGAQKR